MTKAFKSMIKYKMMHDSFLIMSYNLEETLEELRNIDVNLKFILPFLEGFIRVTGNKEIKYEFQPSEFRSAFSSDNLNGDYEEAKNGYSCRPEHWKTVNFVDNKYLIKEEKFIHSSNLVHLYFVSNFFCCCYKFRVT